VLEEASKNSFFNGFLDGTEQRRENSRLLEQFEICGELGRGASGVVLKARDLIDDQEYALKIIPLTLEIAGYALEEPKV